MKIFFQNLDRRIVIVGTVLWIACLGLTSVHVRHALTDKHSDSAAKSETESSIQLRATGDASTNSFVDGQIALSSGEVDLNSTKSGISNALWEAGSDANGAYSVQFCQYAEPGATRVLSGVDACKTNNHPGEPRWSDSKKIPWEAFAYGEHVGPFRTPHMDEYRIHIGDQVDFLYQISRKSNGQPYRFQAGDELQIRSGLREELNQERQIILPDGTISPTELGPIHVAGKTIKQVQDLLNKLYQKGGTNDPLITVMALKSNTALNDLIASVQGNFNNGGVIRSATVLPDGSVHLPRIGRVPALGLTISELTRETNFRYGKLVSGLYVSALVTQRAQRFIYVLGEVENEGRIEMVAPTTALQALALAGGELQGANLRHIVVLRRDENWRLIATRLDLQGAVYGRRPQPSDEIWLRDSDIVIVPKMPIQRLTELVDMYITRTVYAVVPNSGLSFNIGNNSSL